MQDGSVTVEPRKRGPNVWCFRWREAGPDGRRIHRRIVLGTADELRNIASARKMVVGLRHEINVNDIRVRRESITVAQGITDSESFPTATYAFHIQPKGHTRAIWENGLTRAGANIN